MMDSGRKTDLFLKTRQLLTFRLTFALASFFIALTGSWLSRATSVETSQIMAMVVLMVVVIYSLLGLVLLRQGTFVDEQYLNFLNGVLIAFDIGAISGLVHFTKGIDSDLYFLYLLPILFASHTFGAKGIFATTTFVSLTYAGLLAWNNAGFLPYFFHADKDMGLVAAYGHRLSVRLVTRTAILISVAFIWAVFCEQMSKLAGEGARRLSVQLDENTRLVSELKTMQSQLVHQEKMASLGRIVAGIAHELNNPVNFVHGNLPYLRTYFSELKQLIQACDDVPEKYSEKLRELKQKFKYDFMVTDLDNILADVSEGAERIRHITRNLKSFSRLDEAELKEANIEDGIESTLKILGQYFGRDRIPVECEFGNLPLVLCYPGQLNQVWMNLLSNAGEAVQSADSPKVKIGTKLEGSSVVVTISDNGPGINVSDQSKIFEPFFTTKPVGQGTGLGLSICHSIIERHGGKIWFECKPNQGTTFIVKIPIQARAIKRTLALRESQAKESLSGL
ncbi:MAG: HAMP domain-containing histidine kinase [Candidatus Obscuribacterales bacterium]|nr:HAMP domain-containing histidine kinase [Candidatus Obscuribacterales bacterium]